MKNNIEFSEFQEIAKSILKRLTDYLDVHSLRYFLAYGTLLGAIRHQDIIPWDYDIDIQMPRQDLNRLLELVEKEPIAPDVNVFSWKNTRNYYLPFVKVCDANTRLVITKTHYTHIPFGIWVDIFPLDGLYDDISKSQMCREEATALLHKAMKPFNATFNWKESVVQIPSLVRSFFVPSASYIQKAVDICSAVPFDEAENVSVLVTFFGNLERHITKRELFVPAKARFGAYEYTIPAGYDAILRRQYGDYMQLPPEDERQIPKLQSYRIK